MMRDQLVAALRAEMPACRINIRVLFEPVRYGVLVVGRGGEEAAQAVIGTALLVLGAIGAAQHIAGRIAGEAPGVLAL